MRSYLRVCSGRIEFDSPDRVPYLFISSDAITRSAPEQEPIPFLPRCRAISGAEQTLGVLPSRDKKGVVANGPNER